MTVDQVVQALAGAFVKEAGERPARELLRRMDWQWRPVLRLMASDLIDEGIAPAAFVAFVVARVRAKGPVFAGRVFSLKYFPIWLAQYRTQAASHLDVPGYRATPARRRAHLNRVKACLATS